MSKRTRRGRHRAVTPANGYATKVFVGGAAAALPIVNVATAAAIPQDSDWVRTPYHRTVSEEDSPPTPQSEAPVAETRPGGPDATPPNSTTVTTTATDDTVQGQVTNADQTQDIATFAATIDEATNTANVAINNLDGAVTMSIAEVDNAIQTTVTSLPSDPTAPVTTVTMDVVAIDEGTAAISVTVNGVQDASLSIVSITAVEVPDMANADEEAFDPEGISMPAEAQETTDESAPASDTDAHDAPAPDATDADGGAATPSDAAPGDSATASTDGSASDAGPGDSGAGDSGAGDSGGPGE